MSSTILRHSTHRTRDILRFCRHASTSSNPYPYPPHQNPHPHQIFHLPRSATQKQIKGRYYDLVRIYHPDSPIARKYPADVAQARFQAISKAYDLLRGKSAMTGDGLTDRERPVDPARFRPRAAPRRPHFNDTAGDERWKERVLLGATMLVRLFPWRVCATIVLWTRPTTRTQALVAFVVQTNVARQKAFVEVTHGARTGSSGPKHSLAEEALAEPTDAGRSR
ncbi:hypothetical protein V8E55_004754 [Tylopilus felleus]